MYRAERRSKLEKFSHQAKNWSMLPFLARSWGRGMREIHTCPPCHDMSSIAFLTFF